MYQINCNGIKVLIKFEETEIINSIVECAYYQSSQCNKENKKCAYSIQTTKEIYESWKARTSPLFSCSAITDKENLNKLIDRLS